MTASSPIDPSLVPKRRLASGAQIPVIGLGTFGSDSVSGEAIADAVLDAGRLGYRHFDCAAVYGNERLVGHSLRKLMAGGVKREELWITSKLWNDKHAEQDVAPAFRQSLNDLQLDYLDLYLVHWPFPNFHPPGCDVNFHDPNARPYVHENFMKTWRQLEKLVDQGLVRHIGTSNMTIPKLKLVLRDARIRPACNEMELHPHFQQADLFAYVREQGLEPIGYCPLGSPGRPERDRTPEDTSPLDDPVILEIARAHGIHCRGGLSQMGRPARPDADPLFRQTAQLSRQPSHRRRRPADRIRNALHRAARPELPPRQRPGFLLER